MRWRLCKLLGHKDEIYGLDIAHADSRLGNAKHRCPRCGKTWLTPINVIHD